MATATCARRAQSPSQLHAAIPGSKLVVLPGIGHIVNLEAPERFNAEVGAFLARAGLC
jgi:pimeloyl-ACP methyl ester carboxylesterase